MTKRNLFFTLVGAVLLLSLSACSDDDKSGGGVYEKIVLTSSINNGAMTKSVSQTLQEYDFASGRAVGAFVTGEGTESGYDGYANVQLTTDGEGGFTGETMIYPVSGTITVNAYAPYNSAWTLTSAQTFSVQTDQSGDEAYMNSDLLYAEATASNSDATVPLKFYHMLSKIDISLSGDTDEVKGEKLVINDVKTTTTFLPSGGTITAASGDAADIVVADYAADAAAFTGSVIVVPQTLNGITVTIGDYTFTYSSQITLASGTRYSFNAVVEKGVTGGELVFNPTISGWENPDGTGGDGESTGGDDGDNYVFDLDYLNPSIWESGTFDDATGLLVTGSYGFGGWHDSSEPIDLSGYRYLVLDLGEMTDTSGNVHFRIFGEDNYWSTPANFVIHHTGLTVIDLENQADQIEDPDGEGFTPQDVSHIYYAGFWTVGGESHAVQINKIYATNTYPESADSGDDGGNEEQGGEIDGDVYEFDFDYLSPSIWESGTFDESTGILVTGQYGFGGWQFDEPVDLSGYRYLVLDLGEETADLSGWIRFRLFDANNYWGTCSNYNITHTGLTVLDLENQDAEIDAVDGEDHVAQDVSHIYIAGFWTIGGEDHQVQINRIYATNTNPEE